MKSTSNLLAVASGLALMGLLSGCGSNNLTDNGVAPDPPGTVRPDGAATGDGLQAGARSPNPSGLSLAGLTAVTVTLTPTRLTDPSNVLSLDLQTRALNWQQCSRTAKDNCQTKTKVLTDYEVTAAQLMLELLSTDYLTGCGADADVELLDLVFADRVDKYQDDFYAGCSPPLDGRTFLHSIDGIAFWLGKLSGDDPFPATFATLTVYPSQSTAWTDPAALADAERACGDDAIDPTYTVTSSTRQLAWSSCVSPNGLTGYQLQSGNRILSESEYALVVQAWSGVQLGATGDCSSTHSISLFVTTTPVTDWAVDNDFTLCTQGEYAASSVPAVGLDDLAALIVSLAGTTP